MAAPAPFEVASIEEPKFVIKLPDGSTKEYDPWKLQEDIARGQEVSGANNFEVIRSCFGLPGEADALAGNLFTFSRNQCIGMTQALGDFIDSLPVSKKALSLSQNSSASLVSR